MSSCAPRGIYFRHTHDVWGSVRCWSVTWMLSVWCLGTCGCSRLWCLGGPVSQARWSLCRLHPLVSQLAGCTLCWVFVSQGCAACWRRIPHVLLLLAHARHHTQTSLIQKWFPGVPRPEVHTHLPLSSSHNSVILARPTFFTYVFRCLTLSRFSAIKGRGKEKEKEERKGRRERGSERVR